MTHEIHEAKDTSACCESYVNATSLDLKSLAHRPLHLIQKTSLRQCMNLFG